MKFLNVLILAFTFDLCLIICKQINDSQKRVEEVKQNKIKLRTGNFLKDSSKLPTKNNFNENKLDHTNDNLQSENKLEKSSNENHVNSKSIKNRNKAITLEKNTEEKSKSGNSTNTQNIQTEKKPSQENNGTSNQQHTRSPNEQFNSFGVDPYLQYYSEEDQFFYVRNIKCAMNNCPPPSFCMDDKTCKCGEGHANVLLPDMPFQFYCQYRQKQQIVAFLLETFLSLGIGHFYSGRVNFGLIKLIVGLSPLILMCCSICWKGNEAGGCLVLSSTLTCAYLIWQIIDIINFATNSYKDGHGVPLEHW
jgi:TM2 domain-containing membrane protein YozV